MLKLILFKSQNAVFDQNMSSFITTKEQVKSNPVISNALRKIAFNSRSFRTSLNPIPMAQQERQRSFLKQICHRINIEQRERIRMQAHEQAVEQLKNLKHKLRKNINQENIEHMMADEKAERRDILGKVMRVPIETISLDKKHRQKINLKLQLMEQASSITNNKQEYLRWYDSCKNSRSNSPIFKKINFLFEKMSHQQNLVVSKQMNCRRSLDSELLQEKATSEYHKIKRKKTEGCDLAKR